MAIRIDKKAFLLMLLIVAIRQIIYPLQLLIKDLNKKLRTFAGEMSNGEYFLNLS